MIKIGKKTYRREYFNKCEYCDLRGIDGKCTLPKDMECGDRDIFVREYMEELIKDNPCPYIKGRIVGCSCEFCDYMMAIKGDGNVYCSFAFKDDEEDLS